MIRGKGLFSREDILEALKSSAGDVNRAFDIINPPVVEEPPAPVRKEYVDPSPIIHYHSGTSVNYFCALKIQLIDEISVG